MYNILVYIIIIIICIRIRICNSNIYNNIKKYKYRNINIVIEYNI
jgi:hypothetical protein